MHKDDVGHVNLLTLADIAMPATFPTTQVMALTVFNSPGGSAMQC